MNCDLGESFGAYQLGQDAEILTYVTSANIACGFHAGDPATMRKTVRLALEKGVAIGAHPGFPDLVGFGRREMQVASQDVQDLVLYQLGALHAFVVSEGAVLRHVKPHGALYNMAAKDPEYARAIATPLHRFDPSLILFGPSGSELIAAGKSAGLRTASEVFADRRYEQDGSLSPRNQPGAVITDCEQAIQQVLQMVQTRQVQTRQGTSLPIQAETICLHGDGPHALEFARRIRSALEALGVTVRGVR